MAKCPQMGPTTRPPWTIAAPSAPGQSQLNQFHSTPTAIRNTTTWKAANIHAEQVRDGSLDPSQPPFHVQRLGFHGHATCCASYSAWYVEHIPMVNPVLQGKCNIGAHYRSALIRVQMSFG